MKFYSINISCVQKTDHNQFHTYDSYSYHYIVIAKPIMEGIWPKLTQHDSETLVLNICTNSSVNPMQRCVSIAAGGHQLFFSFYYYIHFGSGLAISLKS